MFEFADRLHPGEGRAYDVTSTVDASTCTVSAVLLDEVTRATLSSPVVAYVDPYTWRVHVTDSMTQSAAGRRLVLRITVSDPSALNEPEILTALLTVEPI